MSMNEETPRTRPTVEEASRRSVLAKWQANATSVRQALALAGVGAVILGGLVWVFLIDIRTAANILLIAGAAVLLIDIAISWRTVARALFGRRGRYGFNTMMALIAFIALAVLVNWLLFWLASRPDPQGWLRVDTTATKQFILADQGLKILDQLEDPAKVTAFFTLNSADEANAWRVTEDLLSEFRRRSTRVEFEYELIDPELQPNIATELGANQFPALAVENLTTRRTEVLVGSDPRLGPNVFSEQQIITGLLVVNQIQQKVVAFVSGHSERDITSLENSREAFGLAASALSRENYQIINITLQELGSVIQAGDPTLLPAVLVFAGPRTDLLGIDLQALGAYAQLGGDILLMLEPDQVPESFGGFLAQYGIAIGSGQVVDTASFVSPNPSFLQMKATNGQLPLHEITTNFDVLYMPGTAFVGPAIDPASVPLTDDGRPYVFLEILALTTLQSWAETDPDRIQFTIGEDVQGPLSVALAIEAISDLNSAPFRQDGEYIETNMVVIGDTDFASNQYIANAKNGDLLVNSVNWLAEDYELISIRPKLRSFRELVLTTRERDLVRWTGWLLMPSLVGLAGVYMWWRRR